MSFGKMAILAGLVLALVGFVLIDNWQPQWGFIYNIQKAEVRITLRQQRDFGACVGGDRSACAWRIGIPYPGVLVVSIVAIACGIYMENSEQWRNRRL